MRHQHAAGWGPSVAVERAKRVHAAEERADVAEAQARVAQATARVAAAAAISAPSTPVTPRVDPSYYLLRAPRTPVRRAGNQTARSAGSPDYPSPFSASQVSMSTTPPASPNTARFNRQPSSEFDVTTLVELVNSLSVTNSDLADENIELKAEIERLQGQR
jgi:hypothetical protein